ncbi:hypothetical protein MPH_02425 [Macrophomina phaseolina MS6]|uniref:Uncharacterized protein n=1 Tax=Macrophomina phaseolina (strain MS6) TaxID=1126212 RepID=K2S5L3_MACPH|nr:hypothetical protein MPH_02425 [Macrophomina phaseolina MS6]
MFLWRQTNHMPDGVTFEPEISKTNSIIGVHGHWKLLIIFQVVVSAWRLGKQPGVASGSRRPSEQIIQSQYLETGLPTTIQVVILDGRPSPDVPSRRTWH